MMLTEDENEVKDSRQFIEKQPHRSNDTSIEKNLTARSQQHKLDQLENENESPARLDPTRYGDWEKNGRCIDF